MRLPRRLALGATLCLLLVGPAMAKPPAMVDSTPKAHAIIRGPHASYVVRFDSPVNHRESRIQILRGDQVYANLPALADSAVDVLFAGGPAPPPGQYTLRWTTVSISGEAATGDIPFTVE